MSASYVPVYLSTVAIVASRNRRRRNIVTNVVNNQIKEQTMTKQTLQNYLNRDVKVIDVLENEIYGTLVDLTDDCVVLSTSRNTVVISYDYIVQFLVKLLVHLIILHLYMFFHFLLFCLYNNYYLLMLQLQPMTASRLLSRNTMLWKTENGTR